MSHLTTVQISKVYRDKLKQVAKREKRSMTSQLEYWIDDALAKTSLHSDCLYCDGQLGNTTSGPECNKCGRPHPAMSRANQ